LWYIVLVVEFLHNCSYFGITLRYATHEILSLRYRETPLPLRWQCWLRFITLDL
jgi:hypothetical protein